MAAIVITAAGYMLGGPIGGAIGGFIGNQLFGPDVPNTSSEGARLTSLKVQSSTYGAMLPIVFGAARIAGNVIWADDIKETKHVTETRVGGGGKGGGGGTSTSTSTTYTYSVTLAVALCEGEIDGVGRIWANGKLVAAGGANDVSYVVYKGSETQEPSSIIEAIEGSTDIPAFRGTAYIVFDNFQLADFGNTIPNFTFEVFANTSIAPSYKVDFSGYQLAKHYHDGTKIFALRQPSYAVWDSAIIDIDTNTITPLHLNQQTTVGTILINAFGIAYCESMYVDTPSGPVKRIIDEVWVLAGGGISTNNIAVFDGTTGLHKKDLTSPWFGLSSSATYDIFWDYNLELFVIIGIHPPPYITSVTFMYPYGPVSYYKDGKIVIESEEYGAGISHYWLRDTNGTNYQGTSVKISTPSSTDADEFGTANMYLGLLTDTKFVLINANTGEELDECTIHNTSLLSNHSLIWDVNKHAFAVITPSATNAITIETIFVSQLAITSTESFDVDVSELGYANTPIVSQMYSTYVPGANTYFTMIMAGLELSRQIVIDPVARALVKYADVAGDSVPQSAYQLQPPFWINDRNELFGNNRSNGQTVFVPLYSSFDSDGTTLADIVSKLNRLVGLDQSEYSVTSLHGIFVKGFVINQIESVRTSLEMLNSAFHFDVVESDKMLKYVLSGSGDEVSIEVGDMSASNDDPEDLNEPIVLTRTQELELPKKVGITYLDYSLDYQQGAQYSERMSGNAVNVVSERMNIVFNPDDAVQIADKKLFLSWARRNIYNIRVSTKYSTYEPTDIVSFTYEGKLIKAKIVDKAEDSYGLAALKLVHEDFAIYEQNRTSNSGSYTSQTTVKSTASSVGFILDIPLLRDIDDHSGFYYSAYGLGSSWDGASLYQQGATSEDYILAGSVFEPTIFSGVDEPLGEYFGGNTIDMTNSIDVVISSGELSSVTTEQLLDGYNHAIVGNEIIQYKTATLTGTNRYTLTGLLRGRRGTEQYINNHIENETFIRLNTTTVTRIKIDISMTGTTKLYLDVTFGQEIQDAGGRYAKIDNNGLKPYSPVQIGGGKNSSGDLLIDWIRRTRIGGSWRDLVDASLGETTEVYEVDIIDSSDMSVVRTLQVTSNDATYLAADIATDFPSGLQNPLLVNVYQLSSTVGRGFPGKSAIFHDGTPILYEELEYRLVFTDNNGNLFQHIAEIEFFDDYTDFSDICTADNGSAVGSAGVIADAFDNDITTYWSVPNGTGIMVFTFNRNRRVIGYSLTASTTTNAAPKDWELQVKRLSWVKIHSVTGEVGWGENEKRYFII